MIEEELFIDLAQARDDGGLDHNAIKQCSIGSNITCRFSGSGLKTEVQARGGGGALPIMDYTGRLRPKGVPF